MPGLTDAQRALLGRIVLARWRDPDVPVAARGVVVLTPATLVHATHPDSGGWPRLDQRLAYPPEPHRRPIRLSKEQQHEIDRVMAKYGARLTDPAVHAAFAADPIGFVVLRQRGWVGTCSVPRSRSWLAR